MRKRELGSCYWCGGRATSKEHVPPRNLFPGIPDGDLIKVPSCKSHNQGKMKDDERFRIYLQRHENSNAIAKSFFEDRTARSLLRPEAAGLRKSLAEAQFGIVGPNGLEKKLRVKGKVMNSYFEAIVRGLYHYHSERTSQHLIVGYVSEQFPRPSIPHEEIIDGFMPILRSNQMTLGHCRHPKIFSYRYCFLPDPVNFLISMIFYEGISVVGMLAPKGFLTLKDREIIKRNAIAATSQRNMSSLRVSGP